MITYLSHLLLVLSVLGIIALLSDDYWFVGKATLNHSDDKNITSSSSGPWKDVAPRIHVQELPFWLQDYVEYHNKAMMHNNISAHRYMIYTCKKGHHCSGTGNRQRGIMATFLVSILTKRVFLMDIDNPVPLDQILEPHLIRWNEKPNSLSELESEALDVRNVQPNPLQRPGDFKERKQVIRILANGPGGLETIWKSAEMRQLLTTEEEQSLPPTIYKWIFHTLFRPSVALKALVQEQRTALGLLTSNTSFSPYIGIHIRLGGGGAWHGMREERYNVTAALPHFLQLGHQLQQETFHNHKNVPLVIISDEADAKEIMYAMDPASVRYVSNATIVHVDRSRDLDKNDVQGSLQVWADLLLLAQATCLVESLSSFSSLARRISIVEDEPERCFVRQEDGMLMQQWKKYWK